MAASQSTRLERACEACGNRFHPRPEHVRAGMGRFCSRVCSSRSKRHPILDRDCESCGKPMRVKSYLAEIGKGRFCSPTCRYKHLKQPAEVRFRRFLSPPNERGCILWTGAKSPTGYGAFQTGEKRGAIAAHRMSYLIRFGPIPDDLQVLHKCDVRDCVNPDHLFLGTPADNMQDMDAKGRRVPAKGERAASAKLTDDAVREIRERYRQGGVTHRSLAEEYGVGHATIGFAIRGIAWKHVTPE